ncbi:hypothetical protein D3C86_732530 [compost metagenome]
MYKILIMIKKILFFIIILFLFQIKLIFSHSFKPNNLIDSFEFTINEVDLSKRQLSQIIDLPTRFLPNILKRKIGNINHYFQNRIAPIYIRF